MHNNMKHHVILPRDIALYMAQFMPTAPKFVRWSIIVGLERNPVTNKVVISSKLDGLIDEWKERLAYIRRSKQKRYFNIIRRSPGNYTEQEFEINRDSGVYAKEEFKMGRDNCFPIVHTTLEFIDKIPEPFKPLLPFINNCLSIYYTKDGNGHLNGRFIIISIIRSLNIAGKFKDSKIVGDLFVRHLDQNIPYSNLFIVFVLPHEYTSLHDLSDINIESRLKLFKPINRRQSREAKVLSKDMGAGLVFHD